jgi:uncharacterized protein (DUF1330 family)
MKRAYSVPLALLAGVAIGAVAMQGLHAQTKPLPPGAGVGAIQFKLKVYSISELELSPGADQSAYFPGVRQAIEQHHGRPLRTTAGRVVKIEGSDPPKNVALVEWDSLDDALAFYKSDAWTSMQAQRDKTYKVIRRYVVETEK